MTSKKVVQSIRCMLFRLKYWITCIYEFSFALQVPITVIYWVVLFPNDVKLYPGTNCHNIAWQTTIFASNHIFPIFLQGLDFIFNGFRFKQQRIWILLSYSFCYMAMNIGIFRSNFSFYFVQWNAGLYHNHLERYNYFYLFSNYVCTCHRWLLFVWNVCSCF